MTNRIIVLMVAFCIFAGAYLVFYMGIFTSHEIEAVVQNREPRRAGPNRLAQDVWFGLDDSYHFKEIMVVRVDEPAESGAMDEDGFEITDGAFVDPEAGADQPAGPVWHLVSTGDDSPAIQDFFYGRGVPGMKSARETQRPAERLLPGVRYRLTLRAPGAKGEIEFTPEPYAAPAGARR